MKERKLFLIGELNKMGVFYNKDGRCIEELMLDQLEYLHISKKCEFINVMQRQRKNQPVGSRLALGF